jgi:hypothetical protein
MLPWLSHLTAFGQVPLVIIVTWEFNKKTKDTIRVNVHIVQGPLGFTDEN